MAILEVKNLVKTYPPDIQAVRGVSFSLEEGVCFGLLGPNGAGKTTTLEIIENLIPATSGEILYQGKARGPSFREEVGIQFQETALLNHLTVGETLQTFRKLYKNRAPFEELVESCRLEEILQRDNQKISGGQKQRLLLALALANNPKLLFLDEPTTGMDPQARRHLWDIVNKIKGQNRTIVLTTHYMEEAQVLCDEIAIMDQGKIIAQGSPQQLLKDHCLGTTVQVPQSAGENGVLDNLPWKTFKVKEGFEIHTDNIDETLRALIERSVDLKSMTVRSQNLEDLFLKITGKELRS